MLCAKILSDALKSNIFNAYHSQAAGEMSAGPWSLALGDEVHIKFT